MPQVGPPPRRQTRPKKATDAHSQTHWPRPQLPALWTYNHLSGAPVKGRFHHEDHEPQEGSQIFAPRLGIITINNSSGERTILVLKFSELLRAKNAKRGKFSHFYFL